MRIVLPLLVFVSACKPPAPDPLAVTAELAQLRRAVEDFKKLNQPRLDAVEAMDDLAREVKELKKKVSSLSFPPPGAPTPGGPGVPAPIPGVASLKAGEPVGGVGGTQAGLNDLYWVLSRIVLAGEERVVLALYRALPGDKGLQLEGVRLLNADLQILEFPPQRPHVKEILDLLEKQKK
jgi:hypothetical protein